MSERSLPNRNRELIRRDVVDDPSRAALGRRLGTLLSAVLMASHVAQAADPPDPEIVRVYGLITTERIDGLVEPMSSEQARMVREHADRLESERREYDERRKSAFAGHQQRREEALTRFPKASQPPPESDSEIDDREASDPVQLPKQGSAAIDDEERAAARHAEAVQPSLSSPPAAPVADSIPSPFVLSDEQTNSLMADGVRRFSMTLDKASRTYNLRSSFLLCIMKIESAFNINAVSRVGALGLMQLMPATASDLGVNPYDFGDNVMGGSKLIDNLLRRYSGDVVLAMAAYNAGPGNVEKYGGVPPFPETQDYVRRMREECGEPRREGS